MILLCIIYILLHIIYFTYFAIIHPFLHRIHFTKRKFVLTLDFFWFLVIVLENMLRLFHVFGSTYPSYPLYRSFHIFVHVRCNIRRCEKKDVEKKRSQRSTVTAMRIHAET